MINLFKFLTEGKCLPHFILLIESVEALVCLASFSCVKSSFHKLWISKKIIVENIPQNICKQVLNMKLNQIIQGLQFIQVNNIKYNNNSNLCTEAKSDNQIVFTSFINSENLENSQYCIEDTDCSQACGTATCEDDMMCHNKCSDTNTPFCLEKNNDGICVECLVNTDYLNQNQVCEPTTHKCVELPQTCGEGDKFGKEYRAANGSCIQCTFNANIILQNADNNDGIFEKKSETLK